MKFDKKVEEVKDFVTESHITLDNAFSNMTVAELLGVLSSARKGNIKIHTALENWIKQTYPDHVSSKKSDKFEDEPHDIESMPGADVNTYGGNWSEE